MSALVKFHDVNGISRQKRIPRVACPDVRSAVEQQQKILAGKPVEHVEYAKLSIKRMNERRR